MVVACEVEHAVAVGLDNYDDLERWEMTRFRSNQDMAVQMLYRSLAAYALVSDGLVIGVGGFLEVTPGLLNLWLQVGNHAKGHALQIVGACRKAIDAALQLEGVHRIQGFALEGRGKLMRASGLRLETVVPRATRSGFALEVYARMNDG